MTPERRRALLLATFAALAALVAWDRLAARPDELVEPTHAPTPPPLPSASRASAAAIARLRPRDDYLDALQAEAALARAPVAAAAPPPPPSAPDSPAPPPYRVIGKGRVDGRWEVYLAQANRVVVARAGDRLDGQYEVVAIAPPLLKLVLLPNREPRTLAIGPALDD